MTRPVVPAVGDPNWGEPLRQAIFNVSDRVDAGGVPDGSVTNVKIATGLSADKLIDGTTNHTFTAADDVKLTSVGSNANSVVVRWDSIQHTWGARPSGALFGVIWLSTNDSAATAPTTGMLVGDVWRYYIPSS